MHENHMGCAQTMCTRFAHDVHRPCAWDAHMGNDMRRDSLLFLDMFFIARNWFGNIQIHVWALYSLDLFSMVSLLFLNTCLSIMIDLEYPKDSCMHPTRFRAWEWSNPRFPTSTPRKKKRMFGWRENVEKMGGKMVWWVVGLEDEEKCCGFQRWSQ